MSAYILNPEHFGILAAIAVRSNNVIGEWMHTRENTTTAKITNAQRVAKGLARENIRSVATRYPDDKSGNRPGPTMLDEDIEEAAAIYAAHFIKNPVSLAPVAILKLCQSLDYQSCETEDWKDTLAWRQMDWIRSDATRKLAGYDEADWCFDKEIPEIYAFYAKALT